MLENNLKVAGSRYADQRRLSRNRAVINKMAVLPSPSFALLRHPSPSFALVTSEEIKGETLIYPLFTQAETCHAADREDLFTDH
jgi:hypothetical protein